MLFAAFLLGLISSLHCIGMCGPIALMLPVDRNNPAKKVSQIITYHIGRVASYGLIGLVFGMVGRGFYLAGIQQALSIFAGLAMILVVSVPQKFLSGYNFSRPVFNLIAKLKTSLGSHFRNKSYKSFFIIGVLNGLLPCGMVYAALFGAIAMQDVFGGVVFMVLFGLGTVPMMSIVPYFSSLVTVNVRNKIQKIVPYAIVCLGILFIVRGLGMDIPFVSPSTMSMFVKQAPDCH